MSARLICIFQQLSFTVKQTNVNNLVEANHLHGKERKGDVLGGAWRDDVTEPPELGGADFRFGDAERENNNQGCCLNVYFWV